MYRHQARSSKNGLTASTITSSNVADGIKVEKPGHVGRAFSILILEKLVGLLAASYFFSLFATEANLFGKIRALFRVGQRDHRIIGGQTPVHAIFFRRQDVHGADMSFEHLELFAIFEANQIVQCDQFADWDGGLKYDSLPIASLFDGLWRCINGGLKYDSLPIASLFDGLWRCINGVCDFGDRYSGN
jgi:hypothetical protein